MNSADISQAGTATALEPGAASDDRRFGIADLRSHTARGMLINAAYQVGLVAVTALRGVIVAAFLTRSDYGVWGLIGLTVWTAMGLKLVFGANEKYVQQSEGNEEHSYQRAFTVELIYAAASTPVAVGIVFAFAFISGHSSILVPGLVLLLLIPATALQFPVAAFYRHMDYRRQRTLQAVEPLGGGVLTLVLAIFGAGYWSLVVGSIAGAWAAAIVALRASPYKLKLRFDTATLRRYVGFSAPLLLNGIAILGLFQVIYLVGAGPLGLAGLGAFTFAGNLVQFTDQADTIVTDTLYPAICAVADRVELLREVFVKSNRLSLMWALPFGVGMSLFGSDLIHFIIGRHWIPAIPLLEIMGIVTAANHVGYNWAAFVKARGSTWPIAISAITTTAITIALAIPLMHSYHLLGIGYALAIGQAVVLVVRGIVMARLFRGFRMFPHLLRAFVPAIIAALPVLLLRATAGPEQNLAAAIAVFALYVIATVVATITLERPLLREALGYLLRRRTQPA